MTEPAAGGCLLYACVTHVPLIVPMPGHVQVVRLGAAQDGWPAAEPRGHLLRELAPEWEPHHPLLGGTAGTFALRRLVQARGDAVRQVGLCQYRKFVAPSRVGRERAESGRSMDMVAAGGLDPATLSRALDPTGREFVVAGPFPMRRARLLGQYASVHRAQDLLRFTAEAAELGVLEPADVHAFLDEGEFVPGGLELGVYPAPFWLREVAALEAVVRRCIERHPAPPEGPQRRAWSFCCERLGSYLLLRHFRGGGGAAGRGPRALERFAHWRRTHWSRRHAGHLTLVTEPGHGDYVAARA